MDSNTILYVDIGNTHVNFEYQGEYSTLLLSELDARVLPTHSKALISNNTSVEVHQYFTHPIIATAREYPAITFDYDIYSLGIDRYHSVIALHHEYSKAIVIDIGTAITVDKVDQGIHTSLGIAPGFEKLSASFTFATDVSNAQLQKGSHQMILSFIRSIISRYSTYPIVITGGDTQRITALQQDTKQLNIHYKRNMVIDGLKFYFKTFLST